MSAEETELPETPIPLDQTIAEVVRISRQRERRANYTVLAGVIWSFTYTAISLLIMYGVARDSNDVCLQYASSRETVRALILTNPTFDAEQRELLNNVLPPIQC